MYKSHHEYQLLRESKPHGKAHFQVELYETLLTHESPNLFLHWHDEIELIIVKSGHASFLIDLDRFEVKAGDILVIKAGMLHSTDQALFKHCHYYSVVIHPHFLKSYDLDACQTLYIEPFLNSRLSDHIHISIGDKDYSPIKLICDNLIQTLRKESFGFELVTKALLLQLIAATLDRDPIPLHQSESHSLNAIKKVLHYIKSHSEEPLNNQMLSEIAGYSPYHFSRLFKNYTGLSPMAFVINVRLRRAEQLINNTELPIATIGNMIGFESPSYFIKQYKKCYGLTPYQYKKKLNPPIF